MQRQTADEGLWRWQDGPDLDDLPLFSPGRLAQGRPEAVDGFALAVKQADLVIVATPEYAHNMPAALKSAFEWLVASGEFSRKRCLPVTVTPAEPRGQYALQSMLWTLGSMDAQIIAEWQVYITGVQLEAPALSTEQQSSLELCAEVIAQNLGLGGGATFG